MAEQEPANVDSPQYGSIEELFEALEAPLLSYAFRILKDSSAAEDMVQDAFIKLHAQYDRVQDPKRWLYRTVHNQALNHQRRARKVVPLASESESENQSQNDPTDAQPLPDEQIIRWEGIGQVRLSLDALDERSRALIQLKFNDELSYKEISKRTGLKVGHVGYLLHHALKTMAADLAKTGLIQ